MRNNYYKAKPYVKKKAITYARDLYPSIDFENLIFNASMYDEYLFLKFNFVERRMCLFGVKSELFNTVKDNLDFYEGCYIMWDSLRRKAPIDYSINLLDWEYLLYGDHKRAYKEREIYGIKPKR